jgi:hypothetical protein
MNLKNVTSAAVVFGAFVGSAAAAPTIQLDVNSIKIQIQNGAGANSAFGGLNHTGSINFSLAASTVLAGVFIQSVPNGSFSNAGFSGTISNFTGVINLNAGHVTGGNLACFINGGTDSYLCDIVPNFGQVSTFVGGGFKVEGLTFHGHFSDSLFGNVNVSPWAGANLPGSFLQFNFDPNASGAGFADMDIFADAQVVPLPGGAWTGLIGMAGVFAACRRRRA